MDRVLTRKMRLRSGPGYSPISLERLEAGARRLIARNIGEDFTLSRVRWLTGCASKIQVAFDIEWNGPAGDRLQSTPMVLRMEPPEPVAEPSALRRFELHQGRNK